MNAQTIIDRYHNLNGKRLTLAQLKAFHGNVQKAVDSHSHGWYAIALKGILDRSATVIKSMIANKEKLVTVEVEKIKSAKLEKAVKPLTNKNLTGAKPTTLSGVAYKYKEVELGPYKKDFERLMSDSIVMVWGLPGHGKTTWLLKLAQYLAEQNLKVLYVAREEYGRSVFDIKLNEQKINHKNLCIHGQLNEADIKANEVVFLDSVTACDINHKSMEELYKKHPNKLWFLIIQSTKDGNFRGSNEWEHLVDVAGEIHNRKLILRKNRLDPNNSKKAEKLHTEDAILEAKKKATIREAVKSSNKTENTKKEKL